jgi:actin-related protein
VRAFFPTIPVPCNTFAVQVRVDVGGKLLTNHLKELVSYRQWNMMEETFIVNDVKEKCCFVSPDLKRDLETCACLGLLPALSLSN